MPQASEPASNRVMKGVLTAPKGRVRGAASHEVGAQRVPILVLQAAERGARQPFLPPRGYAGARLERSVIK